MSVTQKRIMSMSKTNLDWYRRVDFPPVGESVRYKPRGATTMQEVKVESMTNTGARVRLENGDLELVRDPTLFHPVASDLT